MFAPNAPTVMEVLMSGHRGQIDAEDPQISYLMPAAARIAKCMKASFVPYMQHILPPVFAFAQLDPKLDFQVRRITCRIVCYMFLCECSVCVHKQVQTCMHTCLPAYVYTYKQWGDDGIDANDKLRRLPLSNHCTYMDTYTFTYIQQPDDGTGNDDSEEAALIQIKGMGTMRVSINIKVSVFACRCTH